MTGGVTTIKVSRELRDRLSRLAKLRRTTMADVLDAAATLMEEEAFFAQMQDQLVRLRDESPREWDAYRAEATDWERATIGDGMGGPDA
jgi:predicted transcriptional regulator